MSYKQDIERQEQDARDMIIKLAKEIQQLKSEIKEIDEASEYLKKNSGDNNGR